MRCSFNQPFGVTNAIGDCDVGEYGGKPVGVATVGKIGRHESGKVYFFLLQIVVDGWTYRRF